MGSAHSSHSPTLSCYSQLMAGLTFAFTRSLRFNRWRCTLSILSCHELRHTGSVVHNLWLRPVEWRAYTVDLQCDSVTTLHASQLQKWFSWIWSPGRSRSTYLLLNGSGNSSWFYTVSDVCVISLSWLMQTVGCPTKRSEEVNGLDFFLLHLHC